MPSSTGSEMPQIMNSYKQSMHVALRTEDMKVRPTCVAESATPTPDGTAKKMPTCSHNKQILTKCIH
eukprot:scaffold22992_cov19-Tisochrysis_lutea.AAC.2